MLDKCSDLRHRKDTLAYLRRQQPANHFTYVACLDSTTHEQALQFIARQIGP